MAQVMKAYKKTEGIKSKGDKLYTYDFEGKIIYDRKEDRKIRRLFKDPAPAAPEKGKPKHKTPAGTPKRSPCPLRSPQCGV